MLEDGRGLTGLAQLNELIEPWENGAEALARAFAEALEDDWVACD